MSVILRVCFFFFAAIFSLGIEYSWGQVTLGASPYSQDFNNIGTGLPVGWTVRTGATNVSLGTSVALNTATTPWNTATGQFENCASGNAPSTAVDAAGAQAADADRALAVRQTGSFGDPGAAFELQLTNTTAHNNFSLSFDLMSLDGVSGAGNTTTWIVDYGFGAAPVTFTTIATIPGSLTTTLGTWATTNVTVNFGTALDNYSGNVWIRIWTNAVSAGAGSQATTGIDDFSLSYSNVCSAPTDHYRSWQTGDWNVPFTWESSPDSVTWVAACSFPTSAAKSVDIRSGHTVTINTNASAPNITVRNLGRLTFDGIAARSMTIVDWVFVSLGGVFNVQTLGAFTNTMSISGDLMNNGTFDMSAGGTTRVCNVTFNKNGNQNITGTGATTRFYYMTVNMGATFANILDINSSNFQAPANFLHDVSGNPNLLQNGTIKFSGNYTFTGTLFQPGSNYTIVATAGIWLNNSKVTITGQNDSYIIRGYFRMTDGIFNAGTSNGNSIKYVTNCQIIIEGGTINAAGRLQGNSTADAIKYTQSGGTFNLFCTGAISSSISTIDIQSVTSIFTISGGKIVLRNSNLFITDIYIPVAITTSITGGLIQFADSATTSISTWGYWVNSVAPLTSLLVYSINVGGVYPAVRLIANNLTIKGDLTIQSNTTFDADNDSMTTLSQYDLIISGNATANGNFTNNGRFAQRDRAVTFNGTSNQIIGGTTSTTFDSIVINKSAGELQLGINTTIGVGQSGKNGKLILTLGNLRLNSYTLTVDNPSATAISVGSNSSYIISELAVGGPLLATNPSKVTWNIGTTAGTSYPIPFGTGALRIRVIIQPTAAPPVGTTITASTRGTVTSNNQPWSDITNVAAVTNMYDPVLGSLYGAPYDGADTAVIDRWWEITSNQSLVSNITFSYRGVENTMSPTYRTGLIGAQNWSGTKWLPTVCGLCTTNGVIAGVGTLQITSYTIGSAPWVLSSVLAPLPIELVGFTAACSSGDVKIQWQTASETNNQYFNVEKSDDGENFESIAQINGAGNSTQLLSYSYLDKEKTGSLAYYRLKQTDYDGQFTYSDRVVVNCDTKSHELFIYPNPAGKYCMLTLQGERVKEKRYQLCISNTTGQLIQSFDISFEENDSYKLDLEKLLPGFYQVRLSDSEYSWFSKLIKN